MEEGSFLVYVPNSISTINLGSVVCRHDVANPYFYEKNDQRNGTWGEIYFKLFNFHIYIFIRDIYFHIDDAYKLSQKCCSDKEKIENHNCIVESSSKSIINESRLHQLIIIINYWTARINHDRIPQSRLHQLIMIINYCTILILNSFECNLHPFERTDSARTKGFRKKGSFVILQ